MPYWQRGGAGGKSGTPGTEGGALRTRVGGTCARQEVAVFQEEFITPTPLQLRLQDKVHELAVLRAVAVGDEGVVELPVIHLHFSMHVLVPEQHVEATLHIQQPRDQQDQQDQKGGQHRSYVARWASSPKSKGRRADVSDRASEGPIVLSTGQVDPQNAGHKHF